MPRIRKLTIDTRLTGDGQAIVVKVVAPVPSAIYLKPGGVRAETLGDVTRDALNAALAELDRGR